MINYYNEDITFKFSNRRECNKWIKATIIEESNSFINDKPVALKRVGDISIVFCSDEYLLRLNKQFLKHDYYTDIITFDNSNDVSVSGDIFISIDTVKANALYYNQTFIFELHRVIIHGVLHIMNYDDQTKSQKKKMTEKENYYLKKYFVA